MPTISKRIVESDLIEYNIATCYVYENTFKILAAVSLYEIVMPYACTSCHLFFWL